MTYIPPEPHGSGPHPRSSGSSGASGPEPRERIEIPGDATYFPVALSDLLMAAPLASRIVLGATLPGRVVQAAALGAYAGSSMKDWLARGGVRKVDFRKEFGGDVFDLEPMPDDERRAEIRILAEALNDGWVAERPLRRELAREVDARLTDFLAGITGQEVVTSAEVRSFTLGYLLFPFALGTTDIISGDVAIFRDTGIFEPHVITHEFCHRKGYYKELHAQALAYMALRSSGEPLLVQSARAERLHRHLRVLSGDGADERERFDGLVEGAGLREELAGAFRALRPEPGAYGSAVGTVMKGLYDQRMKLTGQNGLSDYDRGFTDFLWTFSRSGSARQDSSLAAI